MEGYKVIGKSIPKVDALEKVTGIAKYTVDIKLPRMLHIKVLRSPHAHAKILNIDISKAQSLPGVQAVSTGKDVPNQKMYALQDRYVLARDIVRFVGEPVAAVAAETPEIAEDALELIDVDYEALPAVFNPEEALKPNPDVVVNDTLGSRYFSPYYHGRDPAKTPANAIAREQPNVLSYYKVRKGDVDKAFHEADLIVSERYVRPRIQHCCLEPSGVVVQPEPDGGITVWPTSQTLFPEREIISRIWNLSPSKIRMIGVHQGGGFGSRVEGLGAYIHIAILMAFKCKRPVKLIYTREETFIDGITEIPQIIYIKDGVKKGGTLIAREIKLILNAGAYSGNNVVGAYNSTFAASGTYRIPNFKSDAYVVATNEPVSGPFRGFAANPPEWAIECQMDLIAEKLGMDPVELRRKNVLKNGDENGVGEITENIQIENCIDKVVKAIEWDKKPRAAKGHWKRGMGFACSNKLTTGSNFASVVIVKVHPDAVIEVRHSARDLGQGCNTSLAQIAAEEFDTSPDKVKIVACDSLYTPTDHGTISNRVTFHTGNALRLACADAKRQILDRASAVLKVIPEFLVIEDGLIYKKYHKQISLRFSDLFIPPAMYLPKDGEILGRGVFVFPVVSPDLETGLTKRAVPYYSWGACTTEIMVNEETGEVKVLRVAQCFDTGTIINPKICEGQTEGGACMGIGSALYEELVMEDGIVLNPNFVDYRLPTFMEMPTKNMIALNADPVPLPEGPFGAKGFCEGGLIPMTPAISNALHDALGIRINSIPITREKVLKALKEKIKKATKV